jgi:hypothetical protein
MSQVESSLKPSGPRFTRFASPLHDARNALILPCFCASRIAFISAGFKLIRAASLSGGQISIFQTRCRLEYFC